MLINWCINWNHIIYLLPIVIISGGAVVFMTTVYSFFYWMDWLARIGERPPWYLFLQFPAALMTGIYFAVMYFFTC